MITAFIMAGGSGERFWPLSTKEKPKQLLKLIDNERSMIRMTVDRVLPMISADRIFIGTNAIQAEAIRDELPMLPRENVIVEPSFKDTAAAIGYGAVKIKQLIVDTCQLSVDEEITMIVLASDHLIKNEENFRKRLETAIESSKKKKSIVTLGIKPTKPETGYGYIETEECYIGEPAPVKRFWEKPNLERAEKYVASGKYLWNSGMFIFEIKTMMVAFKRYMPKHFEILEGIKDNLTMNDTDEKIRLDFEKFEKISIDFGIMEKAENIEVIPVDFGWNDIGSYPALDEVFEHTETGTIDRNGRIREYNSKNNIVLGTGNKEIALLGVKDMIIVETEKEILVCKKSEAQNIKRII
jgi:mannose-1-phosphate guanylyltransferase